VDAGIGGDWWWAGARLRLGLRLGSEGGEGVAGMGEESDDGTKGTGGAETRNPKQVRIRESEERRGGEGKIIGAKSWGGSGLVD
jgi:hypothetical protein